MYSKHKHYDYLKLDNKFSWFGLVFFHVLLLNMNILDNPCLKDIALNKIR